MEEEQQQQQQQPLHSNGVLDGIARLEDPRYRKERHKLIVTGCAACRYFGSESPGLVDRRSLQRLVDFLGDDSHEVVITELDLDGILLIEPPDGGRQVLINFFSSNNNTLTKVTLSGYDFGTTEDASQLLAAIERNRTITDLTIRFHDANLRGAALGNALSGLMQNMPQLQRLECAAYDLDVEGVRAFQPALQVNRMLKDLNLAYCRLGDGGIRLIADALVGNTTIEILSIRNNDITSNGLADIRRLIESTPFKKIDIGGNRGVFDHEASTQQFASVLSRHEFLRKLNLCDCELGDHGLHIIVDGLVRNTNMEVLGIRGNGITSVGLADITRLLESSTQLKAIALWGNWGVFNDADAVQHFASTLQHKKSSLQELPEIGEVVLGAAIYTSIKNSFTRNQQLNRVSLLLAPPPPHPQQQRNSTTMMLKTWHKAITKFARVPNNAAASAIFKLFQARPQLLEKRLKRPAATASRQQEDAASLQNNANDSTSGGTATATATTTIGGQKRRRL